MIVGVDAVVNQRFQRHQRSRREALKPKEKTRVNAVDVVVDVDVDVDAEVDVDVVAAAEGVVGVEE